MKILTVVGARPQFVKAAVISRAAIEFEVEEVLLHTGQHFDPYMSDIFFEEMNIPEPQYTLGIGGLRHGAMTGRMIEGIEEVLIKEKPDCVIVFGDTNSTLAGAIAASKLQIPIAHIEAGLRSFNKKMPEEINRVLTDHISDFLFTPTDNATTQLLIGGIDKKCIHQAGDVMEDAALYYLDKAKQKSAILEKLELTPKKYGLVTIHRQVNTDNPERLEEIVRSLCQISQRLPLVFPLHPRTKKALESFGLYSSAQKGLRLIDPVGYFDMIQLENNARAILTDSGGVQKEAYFFSVPCVTIRDETEWTELVEHGYNRLSPPNCIDAFEECLNSSPDWNQSLYGKGGAGVRILETLFASFANNSL